MAAEISYDIILDIDICLRLNIMADFCRHIRGYSFECICPQAYAMWLRAFTSIEALTQRSPHFLCLCKVSN